MPPATTPSTPPPRAETSSGPAFSGPDADAPDLGVLLVHGIGEQRRAATLLAIGEPLYRWLFRWFGAGGDARGQPVAMVRSVRSALRPAGDEPAHAELEIEVAGDPPDRRRWLLAESWWAEAFDAPRFAKVAFWMVLSGPVLGIEYAARVVRRSLRTPSPLTLPLLLVLSLLGPLVGAFLAVAVLVVLLLSLIPVAAVRRIATRLGVALAATLGDTFVLLASPLRYAAMRARIEADLAWLREAGCRRVAVVAHSQGAALAHAVLRDGPQVDLLATVGSAVGRMDDLRYVREEGRRWQLLGWLLVVGIAGLGFALWTVATFAVGGSLGAVRAWLLAAVVVVALAWIGGFYAAWSRRYLRRERIGLLLPATVGRWVDLWATDDPVPNGGLLDGRTPAGSNPVAPEDRTVHNRRWMLSDHTAYWESLDGTVASLSVLLADAGGLEWRVGPGDERVLADAGRRRRRRTELLAAFRLGLFVAVGWLVAALATSGGPGVRSDLAKLGNAVPGTTPEWLMALLRGVTRPLGDRGPGLAHAEVEGAIVVLIAALLAYLVIVGLWSFWDRGAVDAMFFRAAPGAARAWLFGAASVVAIGGVLALGGFTAGAASLVGLALLVAVLLAPGALVWLIRRS